VERRSSRSCRPDCWPGSLTTPWWAYQHWPASGGGVWPSPVASQQGGRHSHIHCFSLPRLASTGQCSRQPATVRGWCFCPAEPVHRPARGWPRLRRQKGKASLLVGPQGVVNDPRPAVRPAASLELARRSPGAWAPNRCALDQEKVVAIEANPPPRENKAMADCQAAAVGADRPQLLRVGPLHRPIGKHPRAFRAHLAAIRFRSFSVFRRHDHACPTRAVRPRLRPLVRPQFQPVVAQVHGSVDQSFRPLPGAAFARGLVKPFR